MQAIQGRGSTRGWAARCGGTPSTWPIALCILLFLSLSWTASAEEWVYELRPGDNLWNITTQHLKHIRYWDRLQEYNDIKDPWHMLPGSTIRIPLEWVKLRPTTALVLDVSGDVTAQRGGQTEPSPIARGEELASGDSLFTGSGGSATLRFGDGSTLLVAPESHLELELLRVYGNSDHVDTQLRLLRGRTESLVTPRRGGSAPRYEIQTPAATSAVRGTRYRISMLDDSLTTTEVLEGTVGVMGSGTSRAVAEGFGTLSVVGSPPAAPRPLLAAPDLTALPELVRRLPFPIAVTGPLGARGYRVQLADDQEFKTLRVDEVTGSGGGRIPEVPDGEYTLRMRAIDVDGLEGRDAYRRITVDAKPEPPVLIGPQADAQLVDEQPEFRWAQPASAAGYHFQLARDPAFSDLVANLPEVDSETVSAPEVLAPGQYYWRVATRSSEGEVGPWGDGQPFKRLAPAPDVKAPEIADDAVSFQWAEGLPGDRYEFQFARDDRFTEMVYSAVLDEPRVTIERPDLGYHYLRVRTIDSEGDAGPFGAPQRVEIPPSSYWPPAIFTILMLIIFL